MSTKMKGLLKGLRYISQIFEEEEEPEMQIGFPTDVKHVAHIGWDGPTSNAPSWIQQFREGEQLGGPPNVDTQNVPRSRDPRLPNQPRFSTGSDSPMDSPSRRRSEKSKGTRRHSTTGSSATDSPRRASTSSVESRTKALPSGPDSPARDSTSSTKAPRRKKTKASAKSKSTSATSDLAYSDPGIGSGSTPTR